MLYRKNWRVPFDLQAEEGIPVSGTFRPVLLSALYGLIDPGELEAFIRPPKAEPGASPPDPLAYPRMVRLYRQVILAAHVEWNLRDACAPGAPVVTVTRENLEACADELVLALGRLVWSGSQGRLGNSSAPSRTSSTDGSGAPAGSASPNTEPPTG